MFNTPFTALPRFSVCEGRCGIGKTTHLCAQLGYEKRRAILVMNLRDLADDRRNQILAAAERAGHQPPVVEIIMSATDDEDQSVIHTSVARRIADAIERLSDHEHAVIIITHRALAMTGRDTFRPHGWDLTIDEAPPFVEQLEFPAIGKFAMSPLDTYFSIEKGYVRERVKLDSREFKKGGPCAYWRDFHRMVQNGRTNISLNDWSEAGDRSWMVWKIWDGSILNQFDRVRIYGDNFRQSEAGLILARAGIDLADEVLVDDREWIDRPVSIGYFAADHHASSYRFQSAEMAGQYGQAAEWLASNTGANHLWAVSSHLNKAFGKATIAGEKVSPVVAGSNKWMGWNHATILYSAKASAAEISMFESMNISDVEIRRARETHTIIQFMMRTSLRNPASTAPVRLNVYDERQAIELRDYLSKTFALSPVIEMIGQGIKAPDSKRPEPVKLSVDEKKKTA